MQYINKNTIKAPTKAGFIKTVKQTIGAELPSSNS